MATPTDIDQYISNLAKIETPHGLFNQYREVCAVHDKENAPEIRRKNLSILLNTHAKKDTDTLLLFEAPSYLGGRRSGAPFVNEGMFKEIEVILDPAGYFVKATRTQSRTALTTRIVWNTLSHLGAKPLILETIPFHPHLKDKPMSNRKPTLSEMAIHGEHILFIIDKFRIEKIISVGRTAERGLEFLGIKSEYLRHPAQGGAREFSEGLEEMLL